MSFFDEDDEPTRRAPRPRRTAPAGGARLDPQTLWTRRAIAAGVGLLLFIFLIVVVNACLDSRRKSSLRDYNSRVTTIVRASDTEVGTPFFEALLQAVSQSPEDLQADVSALRASADANLDQARDLSVPGDLGGAQDSLLTALELRADGLQFIAEQVGTALGEPGDASSQAVEAIAGQMQAFLASDVLLRTRVTPLVRSQLEDNDVVADPVATAGFIPNFDWLQADFVADQLGQPLTTGGGGGGGGGGNDGPVAPGLHGNGIDATTLNGAALTAGGSDTITLDGPVELVVSVSNSGENDETDVNVLVTLSTSSGGADITGREVVPVIAQGEALDVTVPLSADPELGEAYRLNVEVTPVPGEENEDNNEATYNVLFE